MNITSKIEAITPEIAQGYLQHNVGNRVINKGTVAFFASMMRSGEWKLNGEAIVFDKNGRLVNGQHRLSACVYANVPFITMVVRGVEEETFCTFDSGRKRNASDSFRIVGIPNATSIASILTKYLVMRRNPNTNTIANLTSNHTDSYVCYKISNGELLTEYDNDADYWQNVYLFSLSCYNRLRLLPISYVGGIISYLNKECRYRYEYVIEFFSQLFFEEKTKLNALRLLRNKLVDDAIGGKTKMTSIFKEQLIVKCWEAYKANQDINRLNWNPKTECTRKFN